MLHAAAATRAPTRCMPPPPHRLSPTPLLPDATPLPHCLSPALHAGVEADVPGPWRRGLIRQPRSPRRLDPVGMQTEESGSGGAATRDGVDERNRGGAEDRRRRRGNHGDSEVSVVVLYLDGGGPQVRRRRCLAWSQMSSPTCRSKIHTEEKILQPSRCCHCR